MLVLVPLLMLVLGVYAGAADADSVTVTVTARCTDPYCSPGSRDGMGWDAGVRTGQSSGQTPSFSLIRAARTRCVKGS